MHTLYFKSGSSMEVKTLELLELKRKHGGFWIEQSGVWLYGQSEENSERQDILDLIDEVAQLNYQIKTIKAWRRVRLLKEILINASILILGLFAVLTTFYKKF
jgi:hypothetical protein